MAVAWAKKQNLLYSDGCCLGKKTEFIRSECEMVSRKVEQGACFREFSSKSSI